MSEDPRDRITSAMRNATSSAAPTPAQGQISIKGAGNVVAAGSCNVIHINQVVRPKIEVKTGDGTISAEQKAELQQLLDRWIRAATAVRKTPLTHAAAWKALNRSMKVNSYHEIPTEKFEQAAKWLRTKAGTVQSMESAPDKDPGFRVDAIRFIKARSKELGNPDIYRPYTVKRFGSPSLADLSDAQVQDVRKWLQAKKK